MRAFNASNFRRRASSGSTNTGTNDGGIAWAGVPANGKPIDTDWIQISRHADDGTIVETWAQMDLPKMMVQVGAMPAPEGM